MELLRLYKIIVYDKQMFNNVCIIIDAGLPTPTPSYTPQQFYSGDYWDFSNMDKSNSFIGRTNHEEENVYSYSLWVGNSKFVNTNFTNTRFERILITASDFTGANLTSANLTSATWEYGNDI